MEFGGGEDEVVEVGVEGGAGFEARGEPIES